MISFVELTFVDEATRKVTARVIARNPELKDVSPLEPRELLDRIATLTEAEQNALETYAEMGLPVDGNTRWAENRIERFVYYSLRASKWLMLHGAAKTRAKR